MTLTGAGAACCTQTARMVETSAMISTPTVRVELEEIYGCSSDGGRTGRQKTFVPYTERILSHAGGRVRRDRSTILCAGGRSSFETCSCGNIWVPVLGRPLELR